MMDQLKRPFQYTKILHIDDLKKHNSKRKGFVKANDWLGTLKKLWLYLSYKKALLFLVFIMVCISSILSLLGPFLIGISIDNYIVTGRTEGIGIVIIALIAVYIGLSISSILQSYWMIGISQSTVYTLKTDLFQHLHNLPISFFDKKQYGELMSRVTNDLENVSTTLNHSFIQILSSILILLGTVSVMIWLSPLLTLITMTIIPFMFVGMKWITKRTGVLFKEQQKNIGVINGYVEETVSGQRIIQAFSQEKKVIADFEERNKKLKESGFWAQTYSGFIPKLMTILNNLSFALIAAVGGIFVILGSSSITIGVIVIFVEYSRQFTRPLNDLSNQFNTLLSAIAGAERVFEILAEKEEGNEKEVLELKGMKGNVEFSEVSFSYDKDTTVLQHVNFTAFPGQTIALVGPTGAGKTTVISLLSRFYEHDKGKILIDGLDISTIDRKSLRKHIGFVLQDAFLFKGTIRDNIRYGKLDAADEEIFQAAKLANAHSFITKLPNQYNTELKQDGGGISQGQKQLISIARVILSNPSILILDEATSNIDTITEIKIQEALQRLMQGRTSFVIAHRLNTIQQADKILVFKNGEIIESGSHETLLTKRQFYYNLYNSQFFREN